MSLLNSISTTGTLSPVPQTTLSPQNKAGYPRGTLGTCLWCSKTFLSLQHRQWYCTRSCASKAYWVNLTPEQRAEVCKKASAKLMGRASWNKGIPCRPETKEKISQNHKKQGHCPKIRGGNGRIAPTEKLMMELLDPWWIYQYAIPTKQPRGSGFPTCYKVDFAWPEKKWALEVDGDSHLSRKLLGEKKDTFLKRLGWTVWRISNSQTQLLYTTWKSKEAMITSPMECSCTTAQRSKTPPRCAPAA